MKSVGIRELKNNLSAYVRAAREGETVLVTDRGSAVARLGPPETSEKSQHPFAAMAKRGEVTLGQPLAREERANFYRRRGLPLLKGTTVSEIIDALREDTI